jgi:hypothetical protein
MHCKNDLRTDALEMGCSNMIILLLTLLCLRKNFLPVRPQQLLHTLQAPVSAYDFFPFSKTQSGSEGKEIS